MYVHHDHPPAFLGEDFAKRNFDIALSRRRWCWSKVLGSREARTRPSQWGQGLNRALVCLSFMTEGNRLLGVLKFGASEHIEQFAQGLLYMNTLGHFVEMETSLPRKDSHEGTSNMLRGDGAVLQIETEGQFRTVAELRGPIRHQLPHALDANVFCMYALRDSASGIVVNPQNFGFGDTYAVLRDFDEFVKRVTAAVPHTGQELKCGLVEYIDETSYEGPVGIFKKNSCFSYQSEFRMALLPGTGATLRFDVGNLSDIVMLGRLSELNDRLRVQVNAQGRRELQIRT